MRRLNHFDAPVASQLAPARPGMHRLFSNGSKSASGAERMLAKPGEAWAVSCFIRPNAFLALTYLGLRGALAIGLGRLRRPFYGPSAPGEGLKQAEIDAMLEQLMAAPNSNTG